MVPDVGVVRTGGSSTAVMDVESVMALAEMAVSLPLAATSMSAPSLRPGEGM